MMKPPRRSSSLHSSGAQTERGDRGGTSTPRTSSSSSSAASSLALSSENILVINPLASDPFPAYQPKRPSTAAIGDQISKTSNSSNNNSNNPRPPQPRSAQLRPKPRPPSPSSRKNPFYRSSSTGSISGPGSPHSNASPSPSAPSSSTVKNSNENNNNENKINNMQLSSNPTSPIPTSFSSTPIPTPVSQKLFHLDLTSVHSKYGYNERRDQDENDDEQGIINDDDSFFEFSTGRSEERVPSSSRSDIPSSNSNSSSPSKKRNVSIVMPTKPPDTDFIQQQAAAAAAAAASSTTERTNNQASKQQYQVRRISRANSQPLRSASPRLILNEVYAMKPGGRSGQAKFTYQQAEEETASASGVLATGVQKTSAKLFRQQQMIVIPQIKMSEKQPSPPRNHDVVRLAKSAILHPSNERSPTEEIVQVTVVTSEGNPNFEQTVETRERTPRSSRPQSAPRTPRRDQVNRTIAERAMNTKEVTAWTPSVDVQGENFHGSFRFNHSSLKRPQSASALSLATHEEESGVAPWSLTMMTTEESDFSPRSRSNPPVRDFTDRESFERFYPDLQKNRISRKRPQSAVVRRSFPLDGGEIPSYNAQWDECFRLIDETNSSTAGSPNSAGMKRHSSSSSLYQESDGQEILERELEKQRENANRKERIKRAECVSKILSIVSENDSTLQYLPERSISKLILFLFKFCSIDFQDAITIQVSFLCLLTMIDIVEHDKRNFQIFKKLFQLQKIEFLNKCNLFLYFKDIPQDSVVKRKIRDFLKLLVEKKLLDAETTLNILSLALKTETAESILSTISKIDDVVLHRVGREFEMIPSLELSVQHTNFVLSGSSQNYIASFVDSFSSEASNISLIHAKVNYDPSAFPPAHNLDNGLRRFVLCVDSSCNFYSNNLVLKSKTEPAKTDEVEEFSEKRRNPIQLNVITRHDGVKLVSANIRKTILLTHTERLVIPFFLTPEKSCLDFELILEAMKGRSTAQQSPQQLFCFCINRIQVWLYDEFSKEQKEEKEKQEEEERREMIEQEEEERKQLKERESKKKKGVEQDDNEDDEEEAGESFSRRQRKRPSSIETGGSLEDYDEASASVVQPIRSSFSPTRNSATPSSSSRATPSMSRSSSGLFRRMPRVPSQMTLKDARNQVLRMSSGSANSDPSPSPSSMVGPAPLVYSPSTLHLLGMVPPSKIVEITEENVEQVIAQDYASSLYSDLLREFIKPLPANSSTATTTSTSTTAAAATSSTTSATPRHHRQSKFNLLKSSENSAIKTRLSLK